MFLFVFQNMQGAIIMYRGGETLGNVQKINVQRGDPPTSVHFINRGEGAPPLKECTLCISPPPPPGGRASEASPASEASYSKRSEPEATELHIRHAKNYT